MPKTIVITGTATGMGRAAVSKFAAEGWNVVATVRKEPDLKAHAGLRCVKTVLLDVDDETAAVPFARLALEQFADVPGLDVVFVGTPDPVRPIGIKGIGEIGVVGVSAAIANAAYHATGRRIRSLPITVEQLL